MWVQREEVPIVLFIPKAGQEPQDELIPGEVRVYLLEEVLSFESFIVETCVNNWGKVCLRKLEK